MLTRGTVYSKTLKFSLCRVLLSSLYGTGLLMGYFGTPVYTCLLLNFHGFYTISLNQFRSPLLPASRLISFEVYMRWFTSTRCLIPVRIGFPMGYPEARCQLSPCHTSLHCWRMLAQGLSPMSPGLSHCLTPLNPYHA
jgi:hypothetical protein